MPKIEIPQHPTHQYNCEKCIFWLATQRKTMVIAANGQAVPLDAVVKAGQATPEMLTADIAPCTKFPSWHLAASNHWCHQYEGTRVYGRGAN